MPVTSKKPSKVTSAVKKKESTGLKSVKSPLAKKTSKPATQPRATAVSGAEMTKKTRAVTKPRSKTLSYTQTEFIDNLQAFCGLEKKNQARVLAEDISLMLMDCLKKGYRIPLFNLGKMQVRKTKARNGVNPMTKEKIKIPAKKKVRFTAAKSLKEAVL